MSRRRFRSVAPAAVALALIAGIAAAQPSRGLHAAGGTTQIDGWSPFDASGAVKKTLSVRSLGRGSCLEGPTSEGIGDVGYRCGARNSLADPCWRDGPKPTDLVVCAVDPWASSVWTIRVRHLMLRAGVTFAAPLAVRRRHDLPWGIELASGDHCVLLQGAHDAVPLPHGERLVVDYSCDPSGIVLLRNLRRGRLWRIGAARSTQHGYELLGDVTVVRAIFGSLPPAMERQNTLARGAVAATPFRPRDVLRARLTFPAHDWAFVRALSGTRVVHRVDGGWRIVHVERPACASGRLTAAVRRQLFGCGPSGSGG